MKILVLEHPRIASHTHFNDIANTPLWSCLMGGYAAAALQAGGAHHVTYLDAAGRGLDFDELLPPILHEPPDLLCVHAVYFWEHTPALFFFLKDLKTRGFGGHINLFGFFPTQVYTEILTGCPAVDSVAVGECEQTLTELAAALQTGALGAPVPGLALRLGGKAILAERRKPVPYPDRLPFPVRDPAFTGTISILGSRGCYNHCSFCPIPGFYNDGPLWRGRTPENIVAEMTSLAKAGSRDFYFVDPNFIGPGAGGRERAVALSRLLEPLAVTFGMETRAGDLTADLLAALRRAGLTSLLLGAESGSASQLQAMRKAQSSDVTMRALRLCRQAGIEPEIGFLMFLPNTTLAHIHDNLSFLEHNQLLDRLDRSLNLLSHQQITLKGTLGYDRLARQERLTPSGCFGFQGQAPFSDPRVSWLAETWLPFSRHLLRAMSRATSPIYWKRAGSLAHDRLNREVLTLFRNLLKRASAGRRLPDPEGLKAELTSHIDGCIEATRTTSAKIVVR